MCSVITPLILSKYTALVQKTNENDIYSKPCQGGQKKPNLKNPVGKNR